MQKAMTIQSGYATINRDKQLCSFSLWHIITGLCFVVVAAIVMAGITGMMLTPVKQHRYFNGI